MKRKRKIQTQSRLQESKRKLQKVKESYRKLQKVSYKQRNEMKRKPERAADRLNFQAGLKLLSPSTSGKHSKKQHIQDSQNIF